MTEETFKKAQEIHSDIAAAQRFLDAAEEATKIRVVCDGQTLNISKATKEILLDVLTSEKEKWKKELEEL